MPQAPKSRELRRRRNVDEPRRAVAVTLDGNAPRKVPKPPAFLKGRTLQTQFRELWRTSAIALLWRDPEDVHAVARLVLLRARLERDPDVVPASIYSAVSALEASLLLTVKARRASGVEIRDEREPTPTPQSARRSTMSQARQQRILRALPPLDAA